MRGRRGRTGRSGRGRRWRWRHMLASLGLAGLLGLLGGAFINGWRWLPTGQVVRSGVQRGSLTMPLLEPLRGRVLFVSPHPDDETLAASGIIQDVLAHGGTVDVVFLTSGDGFPNDARATNLKPLVTSADNLRLGRTRMHEARVATGLLGVPPDHVRFLGFPDRGLGPLLGQKSDLTPYRSPFTGADRVPYARALHPGAPYTRRELERQLGALLDRLHPDVLLAPSVLDNHPDHRAAAELSARLARQRGVKLYAYLVHGGLEWPLPKGEHRDLPLTPPSPEAQGQLWHRYDLSPEQEAVKAQAVAAYRTQTLLIGRFMWAFVRTNELLLPAPEGGGAGPAPAPPPHPRGTP